MSSNDFKIVGARFPISDTKLLNEICQARGEDISDFVRRSVRKELARLSFYTDKEKKALEVPAKRLGEFEEVIGVLQEIKENEERMTLSFNNGTKIILSSDPQLKKKLEEKIGKKVGILRIDNKEGRPYLIREVEVT